MDDTDLDFTNAEAVARAFHETYERLASLHDYEIRAKPWAEVPDKNKRLMIAVAEDVIARRARIARSHWAPNGYFGVDVFGVERETFEAAMELAFSDELGTHCAKHYEVDGSVLRLFWSEEKGTTAFPYALKVKQAIEFTWGWLEDTKPTTPEPRADGTVVMGFRVRGPSKDGWSFSFVEIIRTWAIYGK